MSFFLLAKHPDDRLELLSSAVFETRPDALRALSATTEDPAFDSLDTEVLVVDLDTATPVLIVRSSQQSTRDVGVAVEPEPESGSPLETADGEDAFVAVADEAPVIEVDEVWAAAALETVEADDAALRNALARTTAQMESEGVSALASVEAVPEAVMEIVAPEPEPVMPEPAPVAVEPEPEPILIQPAPLVPPVEPMSASETPAWPWDAATDLPAPPVIGLDAFDEVSLDDGDGGLVRAAGDDAAMAASRPVILGAYDETVVSPVAVVEEVVSYVAITEPLPEPTPTPAPAPEVAPEPAPAPEAAPEPAPAPEIAPESDFILDLDPIAAVPAPPGYEVSDTCDAEISTMSCDDCVYVGTCPNKDERDPSSCGSFQWK